MGVGARASQASLNSDISTLSCHVNIQQGTICHVTQDVKAFFSTSKLLLPSIKEKKKEEKKGNAVATIFVL